MIDKKALEKRANDFNTMAAKGVLMPDGLALHEVVYYKALTLLYGEYHAGKVDVEEAKKQKRQLMKDYTEAAYTLDMWQHGARTAAELNKLVSPEADLPKKSKRELVEIIIRFQALLNGTMDRYDGEIPKMYEKLIKKVEEDKNVSI